MNPHKNTAAALLIGRNPATRETPAAPAPTGPVSFDQPEGPDAPIRETWLFRVLAGKRIRL